MTKKFFLRNINEIDQNSNDDRVVYTLCHWAFVHSLERIVLVAEKEHGN
jgi:hypothetical protein